MEDEAENLDTQEAAESEESSAGAGGSGSLMWLVVLVAAAVVASAGGFALARLFGGPSPVKQAQAAQASTKGTPAEPKATLSADGDFIYYHFEPITVNLSGDNMNRYIRTSITLAIDPEHFKAAEKRIETKKPQLNNWLTVYLADCTLDKVRGSKALNRLRREITDSLNEQLWPDQAPLIHDVLFKEFFIQ